MPEKKTAPQSGHPTPLERLTAAPLTDREAPAPWGLCESCGKAPAIPAPALAKNSDLLCPACLTRALLYEGAAASLADLLAPSLGAWGNFWALAGLTSEQLLEVAEQLLADWAKGENLHRAMSEHPAPLGMLAAPPDRRIVDAQQLAQITAAHFDPREAAPAGRPDRRHTFTLAYPDGKTREGWAFPSGLDVVLTYPSGPSGDALAIFTGYGGSTAQCLTAPQPVYIPARFTAQARAALGFWGSADGVPQ